MSIKRGYIKFPRVIFGSRQWRAPRIFSEFEATAYLCVKAAYVDGLEVSVEGNIYTLRRGQLITSIRNLAEDWGWSKSTIQRLLSKLSSKTRDNSWDNFTDNIWDNLRIKVEILPKTRYSLITICNYDSYNCDDDGCAVPASSPFLPMSGTTLGTTCGTTCGTTNNNDIRNNDITSTHIEDILARYKDACASASTREQAHELLGQLVSTGFFQSADYYKQSDAFKLLSHVWAYHSELQLSMERPMVAKEAIQFVTSVGFTRATQDDVARVLQAMSNAKGLTRRNRSVYHTLRKWLSQDIIRKKRIEDEQARIYRGR